MRLAAFALDTLQTEVLDEGDLTLAIRASCCFPGMFQPVKLAIVDTSTEALPIGPEFPPRRRVPDCCFITCRRTRRGAK